MPVKRKTRGKLNRNTEERTDYDEETIQLYTEAALIQYKHQIKQLEIMKNHHIKMIQNVVEYGMGSLPAHVLDMPLGELRAMSLADSSMAQDIGFEKHGRSSSFSSTACASAHTSKVSAPAHRRSCSYKSFFESGKNGLIYVTPGVSGLPVNAITPKVNPSSPLGLLRIPRQGEFAVSAAGSPLLVSAVASSRSVNVNIPLKNGKMFVNSFLVFESPQVRFQNTALNAVACKNHPHMSSWVSVSQLGDDCLLNAAPTRLYQYCRNQG